MQYAGWGTGCAAQAAPPFRRWLAGALAGALVASTALAQESAVTVLTDFEDASVAAQLIEFRNVLPGDCDVNRATVPARGQGSLAILIGATVRDAGVVCSLVFREPTRFAQATRIGTYVWIDEGEYGLAFRVRDARGQVFETPAQGVTATRRWNLVQAELAAPQLTRVSGDQELQRPLEVDGYRLTSSQVGRQTVYLDELLVEHTVAPHELVRGTFEFNEPTHLYEPNSAIAAAVILENRSRDKALNIAVDLAWTRSDGSVLHTERKEVSLPASGVGFRSHRRLDFSQRIRDPGLYRLVAQARAAGWSASNAFETTIAVTPSNRGVARGRSTFFGVRSNLLREPALDQTLEIAVARNLGVNLLALEVPWHEIEPKSGAVDTAALDPLVAELVQKDIAPLLVLTQAPGWAPPEAAARAAPLTAVLKALATRFGDRVQRYQLSAAACGTDAPAAQLELTHAVRTALTSAFPKLELLPPPLKVGGPTAPDIDVAKFAQANPGVPLVFATTGDSGQARAQLEQLRAAGGFQWQPSWWWLHHAEPLAGSGHLSDAEDVLGHYVAAALAGVAGVMWQDLRDDDNDPGNPEALRGLVRRDFSPKTSLLGYATTAGMLTGYRCAGPAADTPPAFQSALFIGAARQVAVMLPQPNVVLPAVVVPFAAKPGEITALDFERRALPVLTSAAPPLVPVALRPFFIVLTLKAPQSDPQLSLARPWLRVPAIVFCDEPFAIELDASRALAQSYIQMRLPRGAPLESTLTGVSVKAEAGETVSTPATIKSKGGSDCPRTEATLRVSLEGTNLDVPLDIRGLTELPPGTAVAARPEHLLGELKPPANARASAKAFIYGTYTAERLQLLLHVEDEKLVALTTNRAGTAGGDQVIVGLARENHPVELQLRLDPAAAAPAPEPLHNTPPEALADWKITVQAGEKSHTFEFAIPAAALGGPLAAGERILLAVRYMDDDADVFPAVPLEWGGGLDGSHATTEYQWLRLAAGE